MQIRTQKTQIDEFADSLSKYNDVVIVGNYYDKQYIEEEFFDGRVLTEDEWWFVKKRLQKSSEDMWETVSEVISYMKFEKEI